MLRLKKLINILFITIILIMVIFMAFNIYRFIKAEQKRSTEGMFVTILGESTLDGNGSTNAMGYMIRSKNGTLIMVDSGYPEDANHICDLIKSWGNGTVDYWFVTHPHIDHVGALTEIMENHGEIQIKNLCCSVLDLDYYEENDKRGFEAESNFINALNNSENIENIHNYKETISFEIDNIRCDILRVANPDIKTSEGGNESTMVFKLTATDVDKSMIFLGDIYKQASKELLEKENQLKADAVQMAHHGQNGAPKEIYDAIMPEVCFFNTPKWLYNNDGGNGINSGRWKTIKVRKWVIEYGARSVLSFKGDQTYRFWSKGISRVQ